jgi:uncharacterized membrane protein HdeD (DUF308 family)
MIERIRSHWWLFLVRGILALLFGIAVLVYPGAGLLAIAWIFAIYAFVDGIVALVTAVRMNHADGNWGWLLFEGVLGIIAGIIAAVYPFAAAFALAWLLGAWAIITGVLAIASAFSARVHIPNEWLWVLSGVVSLIFGIAIFASPAFGLFALIWMVAFYAILAGVLLIGFAFRIRNVAPPPTPAAA